MNNYGIYIKFEIQSNPPVDKYLQLFHESKQNYKNQNQQIDQIKS